MNTKDFFPPRPDVHPSIYAYEDTNPNHEGLLKIGYTAIDVERRIHQQFGVIQPEAKPYRVVFAETAVRSDGTSFMDHDLHKFLKKRGFENAGGEWFRCSVEDVRAAWIAVRDRTENDDLRIYDFKMRPEQKAAVDKTRTYFESVNAEGSQRTPKFLWNAKMRFGKTFATYELAKRMGMRRVLVLTFKPAVQSAWDEDLSTHIDFEGWQFVSREGRQYEECDPERPIVCFGSFQDYLGLDKNGNIKERQEWVRLESWDLVVFDEYHFGAWKDSARKLFSDLEKDNEDEIEDEASEQTGNEQDETWLPIETKYFLFLSGTPFRALNSGEFIEEQIFNWTYSDEQREKENWDYSKGPNPYESLPRMVLLTYQMPEDIKRIALKGETNEFDINLFFSAKGEGDAAEFVYKDYVQKWLDLMRGSHMPTTSDELKLGEKPAMPYSDVRLLGVLGHTLWFLPKVNSCFAMRNLLTERQNAFFHDYTINVCAGPSAGMGVDALSPVQESMRDPLNSKSITLSCGKLTTGVTVRPWTGVFMLRNLNSPETYFQTAFRVQSPWVIDGEDGKEVVKKECYIFDFALDRALTMVSDYGTKLGLSEEGPEQKVGEFIRFLPVLAYDGSRMKEVSASEILDIAMAGTSATLLARRWESALLVNVDNDTLRRLLANDEAIAALMSIEGFRSLNSDIETIINKSEAVKKAKREKGEDLTPKEKKRLSEEEKEFKSKRKEIQEKLIKFATRIPVFMYLTDYREETLYDVITQLEPGLFKKVTGLTVNDFNLLVSLGLFNSSLMNDAVYKFRRYEDASLIYTGVDKHKGEAHGLFDTTLSDFDYMQAKQQESMIEPDGTAKKKSDQVKSAWSASSSFEGASTIDSGSERVATEDSDWITAVLSEADLSFVDRRDKGGVLWVVAGDEVSPVMDELGKRGASFTYKAKGGKAIGGRSGWWISGHPDKTDVEEPDGKQELSEDDIASIEAGTTVFHKSFGYGKVLNIGDDYIEVSFDEKKKSRKFLFPSSFYQGLLQV